MIDINVQKTLNSANGKFLLDAKLSIKDGEFVAIYGKSGSGKTTILRLLAGFETPDSGAILANDTIFYKDKKSLAIQKRNIGFLFQDYALFENMSVIKNLLFAKKDISLANELLDIMDISSLKNQSITNLSGGQKQRVAFARALMIRPKILLLDEPLSALDTQTREKLQEYLIKINKQLKITTIIISHDVAEIYKLCDKVFFLDGGRIIKSGTPRQMFLKQQGSQKLAFNAKILDIKPTDTAFVVLVLVSNQLCKVVLSKNELKDLNVGDEIMLSIKAFGVNVQKIH
ncbi:ABC transporter ATP-binding protein [Campylobacter pinnipediorum]|uniref:GTPase n=1 Tax=Campylobacter pinnipediorum subsp. pinnipediorum TaxID=1660067 RepID=A0AAX0LD52_9BACT|nr:ATP-binding cassette domain-containing protein [Campylobacter pinnipediorum]AQW83198.1 molybdenum ABC transporter ModABC, ATP-binding protein [Campylobacter pinnipediorum subsp. pinnipediorum]AQW84766.1 molybdenum ABC transporter ModABC, ATP-binding protein [Campylobacter pinnipediorum subsp. pinnipediorum]OPA79630.1 GTPase [Campylobacter pinnipediorum subsp. pinnipediorum]OPA81767.1 GTPase [Campylobacter pinnipediorum subsp. pinnipediorum]